MPTQLEASIAMGPTSALAWCTTPWHCDGSRGKASTFFEQHYPVGCQAHLSIAMRSETPFTAAIRTQPCGRHCAPSCGSHCDGFTLPTCFIPLRYKALNSLRLLLYCYALRCVALPRMFHCSALRCTQLPHCFELDLNERQQCTVHAMMVVHK